ncbi:hypothetical protein [Dyadobacter sp. 3J3]|uniref:hypothetical protein n=1 Tax=Dyadobacter sp. 3J3 TaxID=2606600 RepID=UPI0013594B08|nr:hypothetical protein [Dyadobacter sp. 3J3]
MNKLYYLLFAAKTVFSTCNPDKANGFDKIYSHYTFTKIGKLPVQANESSGIAKSQNKNAFWTHNDSGGKPELYEIDFQGKLLSTKPVPDAKNSDWEDLAEDNNGTIYIGDFGNNDNTKRQLTVYKVAPGDSTTEKITFNYADQKQFPPSQENFNYDCEAMLYHNENLFLFSKNWSRTNKYVRLYQLPAQKGNYTITPFDSIQIDTPVTSADISPDGKIFALLTYGKILLFGVENNEINFKKPMGCFKFVRKQAEALMFVNNTDMIVTNEQQEFFRITYR